MKILNRRAKFDYQILETLEAGLVLAGSEAKAARLGHVSLDKSFAKFINNEVYLINAQINIEGKKDYHADRSRKLLLHKVEISSINAKIKAQKLTLVPLSLYNKHGRIKLELALAKSKRKFEKRESIKKRDIERTMKDEFRS